MLNVSLSEFFLTIIVATVILSPKDLNTVIVLLKNAIGSFNKIKNNVTNIIAESQNSSLIDSKNSLNDTLNDIEKKCKYIVGDDGNLYESYSLDNLPKSSDVSKGA